MEKCNEVRMKDGSKDNIIWYTNKRFMTQQEYNFFVNFIVLYLLPDSDVPRGRAGQLILPVTIFSILRSWCQIPGSDRENRGKEKIIFTNEKEKKWRKRG